MTDLNPSRPKTDKKDYKLAVLPNGMKVVVVSSCSSARDRAAASLTVGVGSFSDPPELEGCAHYLEHMVFMGSDKYSDENKYDAYVSAHGGFCNAFTEGEYTNYVFDVAGEFLPEAFDIFAHCFIAPKLSIDSSDRELQAIDSEFHLAEMSDEARGQEVLCSCANDGHFFKKFSWGNLKSLVDGPLRKGIDPNARLREFYETHYTPDNMSLVVISPRSTDEMLRIVQASFGDWNPICNSQPKPLYEGYPFMGKVPSLTRFQSVKNVHRVDINWVIPACNEALHYRHKADHYIAHLLGHEGAGSVLSTLKARGYATSISAGVGEGSFSKNSKFSIFEVSVSLTVAGLANWMDVVGIIYCYLQLIEAKSSGGPPKWIHDELKCMSQLEYDYCDEQDDSDFVEDLSVKLALFDKNAPPLDLLPSDDLQFEWDPDIVVDALAALSPYNGHIQIVSSAFKNTILSRNDDEENCDDKTSNGSENDKNKDEEDSKRSRLTDLCGDNGEDEDDELDSTIDSDTSSGGCVHSEDSSEDNEDEGLIPSLAEIAALYDGPECWRQFADPEFYSTICAKREEENCEPSYRVEPNFGTKYWYDDIPEDLLSAWNSWYLSVARLTTKSSDSDASVALKTASLLSLPVANPYVPSIEPLGPIFGPDAPDESAKHEVPVPLDLPGLNDRLMVYRYFDNGNMWAAIPKAVLSIKFSCNIIAKNIHFHVANHLANLLLQDFLNETLYMVYMAGITCHIEADDFGFTFVVSGFTDKMPIFLAELLGHIFNKEFEFLSEHSLKSQSELLLRRYNNEAMKAGSAASLARKMALLPSQFSGKSCQQVLSAYSDGSETIKKLRQFMGVFMQSCVVDVLVHGKFADDVVNDFVRMVSQGLDQHTLLGTPQFPSPVVAIERRVTPVTKLPAQSLHILRASPRSPAEKNICVELYYQGCACDLRTMSYLDLLEQCLSEPFFNELRTKQQLGYSVSCGTRLTYDVPGICFTVVSSAFGVSDVQKSMLNFIQGIPSLLEAQGEELYAENVQSLLNEKSTPDVSVRDQAMRFWSEISDRRLYFGVKQEQIDFFRNPPSLSELVAFTNDFLIPSPTSSVRAILVQCSSEYDVIAPTGKAQSFVDHPMFRPILSSSKFVKQSSDLHQYAQF